MIIEPIEESEPEDTNLESEKEDMKVDPQLVVSMVHALAGYANPQMMKIGGFLRHQPVTILIDTGSTNNFMNSKIATPLTLQIEDYSRFNIKVADGRILKCNQKCPRWDLTGSSLGDSLKGSGSSLRARREITRRRPNDLSQECRRIPDWRKLGLSLSLWSLSVVIVES
ncbi:hypothetical protein GW17_00044696 [Ensete ventricosum]|nr:hypothetical protein GW17_00044696 [Ensete ventricosum]RZS16291.1 hypothetical protein BHM03_00048263 [Ensete ventricosum]